MMKRLNFLLFFFSLLLCAQWETAKANSPGDESIDPSACIGEVLASAPNFRPGIESIWLTFTQEYKVNAPNGYHWYLNGKYVDKTEYPKLEIWEPGAYTVKIPSDYCGDGDVGGVEVGVDEILVKIDNAINSPFVLTCENPVVDIDCIVKINGEVADQTGLHTIVWQRANNENGNYQDITNYYDPTLPAKEEGWYRCCYYETLDSEPIYSDPVQVEDGKVFPGEFKLKAYPYTKDIYCRYNKVYLKYFEYHIPLLDEISDVAFNGFKGYSHDFSGLSFQWYKDDKKIKGAIYPEYAAEEEGLFKLIVTYDESGCTEEYTCYVADKRYLKEVGITPNGDNATLTCADTKKEFCLTLDGYLFSKYDRKEDIKKIVWLIDGVEVDEHHYKRYYEKWGKWPDDCIKIDEDMFAEGKSSAELTVQVTYGDRYSYKDGYSYDDKNGCKDMYTMTIYRDVNKPAVKITSELGETLTCKYPELELCANIHDYAEDPHYYYKWFKLIKYKYNGGDSRWKEDNEDHEWAKDWRNSGHYLYQLNGEVEECLTVSDEGVYLLYVYNKMTGCYGIDYIKIDDEQEEPKFYLHKDYDELTCENEGKVTLELKLKDGYHADLSDYVVKWFLNGTEIADRKNMPVLYATEEGTYKVTVKNKETGCQNVHTFYIYDKQTEDLGITLTPNDDYDNQVICDDYKIKITALKNGLPFMDDKGRENWSKEQWGGDWKKRRNNYKFYWYFKDANNGFELLTEYHDDDYKESYIYAYKPGTYRIQVVNKETKCYDIAEVTISEDKNKPAVMIVLGDQGKVLSCKTPKLKLYTSVMDYSENPHYYYQWYKVVKKRYVYEVSTGKGYGKDEIEILRGENGYYDRDNKDYGWAKGYYDKGYYLYKLNGKVNECLEGVDMEGIYVVKVTNKNTGCEGYDYVEIEENYKEPYAVLNPTHYKLSCEHPHVKLIAEASGYASSTDYDYVWYKGTTQLDEDTRILKVTEAGLYKVKVINRESGCYKELESYIDDERKDFNLSIWPMHFELCDGDVLLSVKVNEQIKTDGYSYRWYKNDELIEGVDTPTYTATMVGKYTVLVTNDHTGCTGTVYSHVKECDEGEEPGEEEPCERLSAKPVYANNGALKVEIMNGVAPYTYEVKESDGSSFGGTTETKYIEESGLREGRTVVIVYDKKGCRGYFTYNIDGRTTEEPREETPREEEPREETPREETPTTDCAYLTAKVLASGDGRLKVEITNGEAGYSYTLKKPDGSTVEGSTDTSIIDINGTGDGKHVLIVHDVNGCRGYFTYYLGDNNARLGGVTSVIDAGNVEFYPNPTTGLINVIIPDATYGTKVGIFDASGKVVLEAVIEAGIQEKQIDLSGNAPGLYLMRTISNGQTATQRIILK
ncbi:T9SS type A sorting domain-containing protein [Limibacter armeniacum]|uniref:T9SS type A sorting domain-containing protein n=1 Tax=Limibacter armeniacum TaxID=466084 RepID=UPI002FE52518